MPTLKLNYQNNTSELCEIGRKYGINRAATLFYDGLFRTNKTAPLHLGVSGDLAMWKAYFTNSTLHEVADGTVLFDAVILQSDGLDPMQTIEAFHPYLKPGGLLILENVPSEGACLADFDSYFVELTHPDSTPSKLRVLTKAGPPLFKNTNKITVITPCCRPGNLTRVKESLNFEYIDEWVIVYDGSKVPENPKLFDHAQIKEYVHESEGISGNAQRNYALGQISHPDTLLYYLDDDNVVHPDLYCLLNVMDNTNLYSFNQFRRIRGGDIRINHIDTAMVLIPYRLCSTERWILHLYAADGHYMEACFSRNKHVYVDNDLCYYNKLA